MISFTFLTAFKSLFTTTESAMIKTRVTADSSERCSSHHAIFIGRIYTVIAPNIYGCVCEIKNCLTWRFCFFTGLTHFTSDIFVFLCDLLANTHEPVDSKSHNFADFVYRFSGSFRLSSLVFVVYKGCYLRTRTKKTCYRRLENGSLSS